MSACQSQSHHNSNDTATGMPAKPELVSLGVPSGACSSGAGQAAVPVPRGPGKPQCLLTCTAIASSPSGSRQLTVCSRSIPSRRGNLRIAPSRRFPHPASPSCRAFSNAAIHSRCCPCSQHFGMTRECLRARLTRSARTPES